MIQNHTINVIGAEPEIAYATRAVYVGYGEIVNVGQTGRFVHKFGRTEAVTTTARTVAQLGSGQSHETFATSNTVDSISSSSTADGQVIRVEGHTMSGGVFTLTGQDVTLSGQSLVSLTTPLARCERVYNKGATDLAGTVYVFASCTLTAGVPDQAANVCATVPGGRNQSFKAAATTSDGEYLFLTHIYGAVNRFVSADVDVTLQVRLKGGVFREQFLLSVTTDGTNQYHHEFHPFLIVPPNSDIRMVATALSGSSIGVSAGFGGFYAEATG